MGRLGDSIIDYHSNSGGTPAAHPFGKTCQRGNGTTYECTRGYCCEGECCQYYYELWWFWFIWVLAILLSFCCAYHHKRKSRQSNFRTSPLYDSHDIYSGACNYPGPPLDNKSEMMGYTKLPIYDDVIRIPPTASPPPPYSSRRQPVNTVAYVQRDENGASLQIVECNITSSMLSLASLSHYIPDILTKANINFQTTTDCNNNNTSGENPNNQTDAIITQQQQNTSQSTTQQTDIVQVESEIITHHQQDEKQEEPHASVVEIDCDVETPPSGACSSRNSVLTNPDSAAESTERPAHHRVIVRSINSDDLDYDSDSDAEDEWMMNNQGDRVDPNNNNVVVDIEKLCSNPPENDEMINSPKTQDPTASIQDLIEDPQAY